MVPQMIQRRLAAILCTDVVGYSRLMETNEAGTLDRLKALRRHVIDPKIAQFGGRIVKLMGDGMLAEFPSVIDAVQCAVELQRATADHEASTSEDSRIRCRIGVNLGDMIVDDDDLYGDGVNIAARLQELAEPGGISISGKVQQEVQGKLDVTFDDTGEQQVKNIARPVRVWRWLPADPVEVRAPGEPLALPDSPSIAVLPFANLSGDPEQEYFSDGLSEDIITDLSKIAGLFVIGRNSALAYKGKSPNARQVSRDLGVRHILEGSVRKSANRVRITAQLIDGRTGGHVWAERYDRVLEDIFAVQDELTREIVSALQVRLTRHERRNIERRGTNSLEAYDWYLRGRELIWRMDRDAATRARPMLERAIEVDPGFAAAYATLSMLSTLEYINRWSDAPQCAAELSRELAHKALQLDESDPLPHIAMALGAMWQREHGRSIAEIERAIALEPNSAMAFSVYASALHYAGRSEEALDKIEAAMRLDPHYPDLWLHFLGQIYFMLERYEDAATALQRRLIRMPDSDISRVLLAACYGHLGQIDRAEIEWSRVLQVNPDYSLGYRLRILPYADPADLQRMRTGLHKAGLPV